MIMRIHSLASGPPPSSAHAHGPRPLHSWLVPPGALLGLAWAVSFPCSLPAAPALDEIRSRVAAEYPSLELLYKDLHAHPELSFREVKTAARIAEELRQAGFETTSGVGGHGVVGV